MPLASCPQCLQTVVEKKIAREQGKTRHDLGKAGMRDPEGAGRAALAMAAMARLASAGCLWRGSWP